MLAVVERLAWPSPERHHRLASSNQPPTLLFVARQGPGGRGPWSGPSLLTLARAEQTQPSVVQTTTHSFVPAKPASPEACKRCRAMRVSGEIAGLEQGARGCSTQATALVGLRGSPWV